MYYDKHKSVFSSQSVYSLTLALKDAPIPHELALVFQWLGYAVSENMTVSTVRQWVDLLRCLTFHDSSGGQSHEANIIPSLPALYQHVLRAEYAIRLVYESREETSSFLSYTGFGWLIDEDGFISVFFGYQA